MPPAKPDAQLIGWPNSATALGGDAMWPEIASRIALAYHRYFSVNHQPEVPPEVTAASESAARAVAAGVENRAASDRLARDMAKLDGLLRSGGQ
jgi:hypothetical protein